MSPVSFNLRRSAVVLGGVAAIAAAILLLRTVPAGGKGSLCPISGIDSQQALTLALDCASSGNTLRLASDAQFGTMRISARGMPPLTLTSADPARPARFSSLTIRGARGWTLSGLAFDTGAQVPRYALLILDGQVLKLQGLTFRGPPGLGQEQATTGLMIRNSREVEVAESRFSDLRFGISMLDADKIIVSGNVLRGMRTDGIRGGGVSNAVITRNYLTNFTPTAEDHPDGIQLWSTNQKASAHDIRIEDNLIERGKGDATQGIFIRDTHKQLPFERVTITGNLVVGGRFNGITLSGARDARIADNMVIPFRDRESWIRVEDGVQVSVENNRAGRFVLHGRISERGNKVVAPISDPAPVIAGWRQQHDLRPD